MFLLFNMLSRLVIAFLTRSKHLLISWLQSLSAVIFGAPKNKVCHCFHCFPICLPWSDGTGCRDLSFLNSEMSEPYTLPCHSYLTPTYTVPAYGQRLSLGIAGEFSMILLDCNYYDAPNKILDYCPWIYCPIAVSILKLWAPQCCVHCPYQYSPAL